MFNSYVVMVYEVMFPLRYRFDLVAFGKQ